MSKLAQASAKYVIKADMEADGVVEKPDVVGAIFGQTEGLLGPDLDLRELQMTGRVGRIKVDVETHNGSSEAEIAIPSSLDATETSLIAAALETIDRVGPCTARIVVEAVEDIRLSKRDYIVDRAKELLEDMREVVPESQEISKKIKKEVRTSEITSYRSLPAGPKVESSDSIVVCEGRSDVVNLLKHGVKNAVAIGGTSVPDEIKDLASKKIVTLFLDGDRGGDLIQKEMLQTVDFDYVARAPADKEVEDLTKKEVFKALRDKMSREQLDSDLESVEEDPDEDVEEPETDQDEDIELENDVPDQIELTDNQRAALDKLMENLVGTRAVYLVDEELQTLGKAPVKNAHAALRDVDEAFAVLFDGKLNRDMVSFAEKKGADYLIGMSGRASGSGTVCLTRENLEA
jgi:DNA primase